MMENGPQISCTAGAAQVVKLNVDDVLLAAWSSTLAGSSGRAAILDTSGKTLRTFRQIEAESRELEGEILAHLAMGEVLGVQIGNHPAWPALFLAALRRGVVVLPLERTISEHEREGALRTCRASGFVTADETGVRLQKGASAAPIVWSERLPVLLKLTSGTTAAPRAIRFGSAQLLADCTQICETMQITPGDLNFGVIPLSHSYGFSNLVTPLLARGVPLALSRDRMPRAVLDDLARTNATVFPGMPVFYQAFCAMADVPALSALRLCISAGAPLPLAVAQQFLQKFRIAIHSFYGSSECGGICYDREARLITPGFVGRPLNDVALQRLEAEAPEGRVEVHSAAVADDYFPTSDRRHLGAGRFVPDDLLASSGDGYRIVGRASDLINVAGKKVNPAEIEAELLRVAGVHEAVVFGRESALRNQEVAACVVADTVLRKADLQRACRERLSGWQVPKRIFFVQEMPVNARGKIRRRDLAKHFDAI